MNGWTGLGWTGLAVDGWSHGTAGPLDQMSGPSLEAFQRLIHDTTRIYTQIPRTLVEVVGLNVALTLDPRVLGAASLMWYRRKHSVSSVSSVTSPYSTTELIPSTCSSRNEKKSHRVTDHRIATVLPRLE